MENFTRLPREDGMWNFLKPDGMLLGEEWFELVDDFREGFAVVRREDGLLFMLATDGTLRKIE